MRLCSPRLFFRELLRALLGLGCAWAPVVASAAINLDASNPAPAPVALPFEASGKSPAGQVLGVNNRYFTLDGQPWFPVMGEFHFSRYPAAEWEREILKMKAGGINVIATYVFWIHHEETQGQFDWTGDRNLHDFIALCAKHGMYVWLRVGPWDHGEARNGGMPDWLIASGIPLRQNNPAYLGYVQNFFNQIGSHVKGMFWKDGGPIIGVQLENEYHPGGNIGLPHMAELLRLAHAAGLDAPFYTATGWDKAVVPPGFLPVFGGYTEQFWSNSLNELGPNVNFFITPIRAEDNVGPNLQPKDANYNNKYAGFPFVTAEMGGGMAIAYHRRPLMLGDDSAAAAQVKLAAGITMLGYYMYHGGANPDGKTPLQETQSQPDGHGYNDMEQKSYDFQAPLGEFGQVNPSYRLMKTMHLFLDDFGSLLAPMATYYPEQMPATTADISTPRVSARVNGSQGFIFINNYERNYALEGHKDFQINLKLPNGTLSIPRVPTTIPSGAYPIWPVNFDLRGGQLVYSTAQLMCQVADSSNITYVFFAWPGLKPEFQLELQAPATVTARGGRVTADSPTTFFVDQLEPGPGTLIDITYATGEYLPAIHLLVLSREQALNLWKAKLAGQDRLVYSPAGVFFNGDDVHLSSHDPADLKAGFYPALAAKAPQFQFIGQDGLFQMLFTHVDEMKAAVEVNPLKDALPSVPAKMSRRPVAMEPDDADFDRAAAWSIHIPASALTGPHQPLLEINYEGDVARLYAGGRLLDDNFYKGTPFAYGVWRITPAELANGLELKILPLRQDTRVYLPSGAKPAFAANGEALELKNIKLLWDYEAILHANK